MFGADEEEAEDAFVAEEITGDERGCVDTTKG